MPIQTKTRVRLQWFGDRRLQEIKLRVLARAIVASKLYEKEVKKQLNKVVGSKPIGPNLRLRIRHSKPGQPPAWQTGELEASIGTAVIQKGDSAIVRIFSAKKYSKTLELGGIAVPEAHIFSPIRLINPLKRTKTIAPRPVWIPTFQKMAPSMEKLLI